jgi:pyridoxamine 5'-phosphate oxidase
LSSKDRRARPLLEDDVDPDPLSQFAAWFDEARETGIRAPEAMTLATATRDGAPSARMVLLKGFDERGFVFYTGYQSRKGRELAENPRAALLFSWDPLGRQVRVEGAVAAVAAEESDEYFRTRPHSSRLAARASRQSEPIESRGALEARFADLAAEYEGREVERPPEWGGYRLEPAMYEFWQHREDRLHDRLRYSRAPGGGWLLERLSP